MFCNIQIMRRAMFDHLFSQLFPDVLLLAVEPEGQAELPDLVLRTREGPGRSSQPRPGWDTLRQYGGDLRGAGGRGGPWSHNGGPVCSRGPEGFWLSGHRRSAPTQPLRDLPPAREPAPPQRRLHGESDPDGARPHPAAPALVLLHPSAALWRAVPGGQRGEEESAVAVTERHLDWAIAPAPSFCTDAPHTPPDVHIFVYAFQTNMFPFHSKLCFMSIIVFVLHSVMTRNNVLIFQEKVILCPCSTEAVISNTGIFVAIANNTLYGSKLYIFLLCQKSLGY